MDSVTTAGGSGEGVGEGSTTPAEGAAVRVSVFVVLLVRVAVLVGAAERVEEAASDAVPVAPAEAEGVPEALPRNTEPVAEGEGVLLSLRRTRREGEEEPEGDGEALAPLEGDVLGDPLPVGVNVTPGEDDADAEAVPATESLGEALTLEERDTVGEALDVEDAEEAAEMEARDAVGEAVELTEGVRLPVEAKLAEDVTEYEGVVAAVRVGEPVPEEDMLLTGDTVLRALGVVEEEKEATEAVGL